MFRRTFTHRSAGLSPSEVNEASRFSCMMFLDVRAVSDCSGTYADFVLAPPLVLLSPFVTGSAPWSFSFTALYPARPCHGLRFTCCFTAAGAKLVVRMGHYSFPVRLFHSRHHAGLSRRTTNPISFRAARLTIWSPAQTKANPTSAPKQKLAATNLALVNPAANSNNAVCRTNPIPQLHPRYHLIY